MNKKQVTLSLMTASLLLGSILSDASVAGHFKKSGFHLRHHRSLSCNSPTSLRNYSVTIANRKDNQQIYWIDGQEYSLFPGQQHTFTKRIGKTNRCQKGTLALPLVEFDRFDNDRRFSSRKIRLSARESYYYFDKGVNIVSLRKQ